MSKELYISSSPHETKVAVLDDDQLVEVYYERDTDVGLVGGIYKGRVNRVLPGMQSAFVDIGLERDAFLYVSDFFEDAEEYDKVVAEAEARVSRMPDKGGFPQAPPPAEQEAEAAEPAGSEEPPPAEALAETPAPPATPEVVAAVSPQQQAAAAPPVESPEAPPPASAPAHAPDRPSGDRSRDFRGDQHERGGRHRRRRGRHFDDRRFPKRESRERPAEPSSSQEPSGPATFEILPGESLAKYSHRPPQATPIAEEAPPAPGHDVSDEHIEAAGAEVPVAAESAAVESAAPAQAEPEAPQPAAIPSEESFAPSEPAAAAPPAEPAAEAPPEPPTLAPVPTETQERRPLWNRFVSSVFGETPAETEQKSEPIQAAVAPEPTTEPSHETTEEPAAEAGSSSEPKEVSTSTEESDAPSAEETAAEGEPEPSEQPAATEPSGGPAEDERSYTLREPSQRPHFAPRRRRGRRGRGGQREIRSGGKPQRQEPRPGNNQPVQISELLKEGQEILVQIAKEPLGRKGARITSHIALPGRYLVYMPTVDHIGVSRKIASEEERLRLKNLIVENKGAIPGGFIVRTAGAGKPDDELKDDMRFLSTLWSDIRRKAESSKAPALLHADLNLVQRILRDILSPDFKTIWLDSEMEYARTVEFVNRCQPSLVGHVKLYTKPTPMFEQFGIEPEIEKALKPKVWLKSGGYIVINQTEALVAIDVNTGKYVGKTNRLEDTIVKTNIDAVNEIVRQIRMRDLGGIIVIDFIDMDERRNRNKVVQALEEALRKDRAPTKILSFNDFGLVAVTRKRVKQSLERTLCEPCSYCSGAGWVKSVSTVCHEILAEAKKMAAELEGDVVTLRVNPEVARALKSREGLVLGELESLLRKNVIVKSDESVHQERFEIYAT